MFCSRARRSLSCLILIMCRLISRDQYSSANSTRRAKNVPATLKSLGGKDRWASKATTVMPRPRKALKEHRRLDRVTVAETGDRLDHQKCRLLDFAALEVGQKTPARRPHRHPYRLRLP